MKINVLALSLLFISNALANPTADAKKIPRKILPGNIEGKWKKNKRITVAQKVEARDTPIDQYPSENDLISWLELEANAFPQGTRALLARHKISYFIETKPFPLSLIKRIQKEFGPSNHTPFTRILNSFFPIVLKPFIALSPCAYEKIFSLTNYKKLNMPPIWVLVDYLRTAPKNAICTSLLQKRLKDYYLTYNKTVIRKSNITTLKKPEVLNMPIDDILKILKSPSLFIIYPAEDVQDYASHILEHGTNEQIFDLMSINLPSHELVPFFFSYVARSHLYTLDRTYGAYNGTVPPFTDDPEVAEHDKDNRYGAKLIALRNHNWKFLDPQLLGHIRGPHTSYMYKAIERWKRLFFQRKMDKESGKVTFLTLEDDYNSISMGTATPEVTEAFCKNAEAFPDQKAQFWNLKFRRNIMIKDALPGVCLKFNLNGKSDVQEAIYNLRMAAHKNEGLTCDTLKLVAKLPEFSWFVSLRHLKTSVFRSLFACGYNHENLVNMDESIYIFGELHKNLAIALKEQLLESRLLNRKRFSYPSITYFLNQNKV